MLTIARVHMVFKTHSISYSLIIMVKLVGLYLMTINGQFFRKHFVRCLNGIEPVPRAPNSWVWGHLTSPPLNFLSSKNMETTHKFQLKNDNPMINLHEINEKVIKRYPILPLSIII